jgi:hypothetical protein
MSLPYSTRISRSLPHHIRFFSTTPRILAPSFLNLSARSLVQENGHFSKFSGVNYIEHSPALQLLRSERDLAEGKKEPTGILLTPQDKDKDGILLDEYRRQVDSLRAQVAAKEQAWHERYNNERQEWEKMEEKSLRLRLMFGVSLMFTGLLAADSLILAEEVDQHCPGCFDGNTKNQLFVVGYLKQATDGFSRWWSGNSWVQRSEVISTNQQPAALTPTVKTSKKDSSTVRKQEKTLNSHPNFTGQNEKSTSWSDARLTQENPMATPIGGSTLPDANTSLWQRLMWAGPKTT